jgi:hypothetical protein
MNVMNELGNAMRRRAKVAAAASEVQREANRANALRSTGPRTQEGKARSSGNATKYGIYSSRVLLPGEDPTEYNAFLAGMYARLKPADELERLLADRAVAAAWKLRRVQAAEASRVRQLRAEYAEWAEKRTALQEVAEMISEADDVFERYAKWEAAQERSVYRALAELRRAQAARREENERDPDPEKAPTEAPEEAPPEAPALPQQVNKQNEANSKPAESIEPVDTAGDDANCSNEPIPAVTPSPAASGEGWGEGDFERRVTLEQTKSPSS